MRATGYLREEIREMEEERARLGARQSQILSEVRDLEAERDGAEARRGELAVEIAALRRALAELEEHAPIVAPPLPPSPPVKVSPPPPVAPAPVPSPPSPASSPAPRRGHRRSKPDPTKAARKARRDAEAEGAPAPRDPDAPREWTRTAADPLHVNTKTIKAGKTVPRPNPVRMAYEGDIELKARDRSPTVAERCSLLLQVLGEAGGSMSQAHMASEMGELLDAKASTAQSIVSQCVRVLAHDGLIIWTGEKVPTDTCSNLISPVWKLVESGEERAAPGVYDPAYEGTTTRPFTGTDGVVRVESSAFEQGKRH